MSAKADIAKLTAITELILADRLQRLRQANEARERSIMQLAALAVAPSSVDLPAVAAERVGLTYQRWADLRRADLNAVIARQTVDLMGAKSAASLAFGRAEAIRGITEKLARHPPRRP